MIHLRTQIRNAVVDRLAGLATTGARVYPSRVKPLSDANLPCLLVHLDGERVSETTGALIGRQATLRVRVCAKVKDDLDDLLDGAMAEVEVALSTGDTSFGGLLTSSPELQEIDDPQLDDSLEKPVGVITLNYLITYYTRVGSPGAPA